MAPGQNGRRKRGASGMRRSTPNRIQAVPTSWSEEYVARRFVGQIDASLLYFIL
jgi:hypothetical protein